MRRQISIGLAVFLASMTLIACDRSTLSSSRQTPQTRAMALDENESPGSEDSAKEDATSQAHAHAHEHLDFSKVPEKKVAPQLELSPEEWKERLSASEYKILRESGTERAFSGELLRNKDKGTYVCGGCGKPLFSSETKFKSGTGWPSFYDAVEEGTVGLVKDTAYGMERIEAYCTHCGGHLGHVFNDGPEPTGLRYCINSEAIDFEPATADE